MIDLERSGLPPHVIEYLGKLLIARGVAKAFLIREEYINYKKVNVLYLLIISDVRVYVIVNNALE